MPQNGHTESVIKANNNIAAVKRQIAACLKKQVNVTLHLGRNRTLRFSGELSALYPALFTVRPDDAGFLGKTSYSYSDVLCGTVRIQPVEQTGSS